MTENEAINGLETLKYQCKHYGECGTCEICYGAVPLAIQALEEIRQYRAIGTVDEVAEMSNSYINYFHKVRKYEAIGTIEDFKALKEKNEPKKPLFSTIHGDSAYHCSSCKKFVGFYDTRIYEYCHNCGQKLDWQ